MSGEDKLEGVGRVLADQAGRASHQAPPGLDHSASVLRAALNIEAGLYMAEDGAVFPITNWFDGEGDECERTDAITCVAGAGGCWFALTLSDFEERRAAQ